MVSLFAERFFAPSFSRPFSLARRTPRAHRKLPIWRLGRRPGCRREGVTATYICSSPVDYTNEVRVNPLGC